VFDVTRIWYVVVYYAKNNGEVEKSEVEVEELLWEG
jgi:hypothetical protein